MFLRPDELVSTATCRAYEGTDESTGGALTSSEVAKRVGWAIGLTATLGHTMLEEHYNDEGLKALTSGTGPDGRELPSNGYVAGRRLGWACPHPPAGVYLPDRFCRTVEEQLVRRLRQPAWLEGVIDAILASWPEDPKRRTAAEWDHLNQRLPDGTDKATVRNRTRQVASHLEQNGHLPSGLCDLEPGVSFGATLLLAAADRQLVTVSGNGERKLSLRVKLPKMDLPVRRSDWEWVVLTIALPLMSQTAPT